MASINHQYRGGCWPTPEQELLLRAALLEGEASLKAWRAWKSTLDFDHIDPGSQRLVPLLYHNLQRQGVKDPLMGKFKGHSRRAWYRNQLLFAQGADLLRAFHEAGIKTMILKGAALVSRHYEHASQRPMNDFDVLVPTEQVQTALMILKKRHWTPKFSSYEKFTPTYLSTRHAHGFEDAKKSGFDLHWNVLIECSGPDADDEFWQGGVSTHVQGVPTLALNPADQLLHVCVHGIRWNPIPPLRWVADVMTILNTSPEIDWNRLVMQASQRRLLLPLREALTYLRELLDAPIPPAILTTLQQMRLSKAERLEYQVNTSWRGPTRVLPMHWFLYLRHSPSTSTLPQQLIGFPKYLQHLWAVEHLWQLPFFMASKGKRRMTSWSRTQFASILRQRGQ
ncbi:MAG: nucleotidyltransferase domain-containing protein [Ardenticatenaceae bacterium]